MGRRVAALSEDEMASLFRRAQAGDQDAMDQALEALEPHTRGMCRRYEGLASRDPALSFDDVLQQGRLSAIRAVNAWVDRGIHPRIYVTQRIRSGVRAWAVKAAETSDSAMSLDQPVGDDGEGEHSAGEAFSDLACIDEQDTGDLELQALLARIPPAAIGAGDDHLAHRLRPGRRPNRLPDDETLVNLVRQGKTMDELLELIGGSRLTITRRLTEIRKSGIDVPSPKRPRDFKLGAMKRTPWEQKLLIIKDYLDGHPGVSNYRAARDLCTTAPTLHKARAELALMVG